MPARGGCGPLHQSRLAPLPPWAAEPDTSRSCRHPRSRRPAATQQRPPWLPGIECIVLHAASPARFDGGSGGLEARNGAFDQHRPRARPKNGTMSRRPVASGCQGPGSAARPSPARGCGAAQHLHRRRGKLPRVAIQEAPRKPTADTERHRGAAPRSCGQTPPPPRSPLLPAAPARRHPIRRPRLRPAGRTRGMRPGRLRGSRRPSQLRPRFPLRRSAASPKGNLHRRGNGPGPGR